MRGEIVRGCCANGTDSALPACILIPVAAGGLNATCSVVVDGGSSMKNVFRFVAIAGLSFWSAACAIHPLPEDVTGVSTFYIVRQIRCEAREAIIRSAVGWLTNDVDVDPRSRAIGFEFAEKTRPIQTLSPEIFRGRVRTIFKLFYD